jgi:hypothetical protein
LIFTDEASFRQDSTLHATWSRIGHPPEVSVSRQRKSVKILGAIELWQSRWFFAHNHSAAQPQAPLTISAAFASTPSVKPRLLPSWR